MIEPDLTTVEAENSALIVSLIGEQRQRERRNSAIRDAAHRGASVDSLSEATGEAPDKIRAILARQNFYRFDEVQSLAGMPTL